jgi:hypothetical protein
MASVISAGTTSGTSLNLSGDTSGVLQLASNGSTTAVTIDTSQNVGIGITSPTAKLHVTNTGSDNSLLVEDSANPDSTPFVVDASGKVLVGSTSAYLVPYPSTGTQTNAQFQQHGTSTSTSLATFTGWGTGNSVSGTIVLAKSKSGTIGTNTIVSSGDSLGFLSFAGDDGTQFIQAASIEAEVDGTPGTNDMPGRLVFSTTADGASSPTERMRIDSSGNLLFNSGYGSVATAYGCRAWISFNGSSGAINGSGNVSSVSNNATGDWTINFSTSMPDGNYSIVGMVRSDNDSNPAANPAMRSSDSPAAGSCRVFFGVSNSRIAFTLAMFAVFR